jgi:hypothetical protein
MNLEQSSPRPISILRSILLGAAFCVGGIAPAAITIAIFHHFPVAFTADESIPEFLGSRGADGLRLLPQFILGIAFTAIFVAAFRGWFPILMLVGGSVVGLSVDRVSMTIVHASVGT